MPDTKYIIVDDEDINLFITKKLLLEVLGEADISVFNSGGEALRYFKNDFNKKAYSQVVLLLDLNMPVISGWDFLEFFEHFEDDLKNMVHIYVVTSSVDPKEKYKALSNPNVIAFVSKPLTKAFILENFEHSHVI